MVVNQCSRDNQSHPIFPHVWSLCSVTNWSWVKSPHSNLQYQKQLHEQFQQAYDTVRQQTLWKTSTRSFMMNMHVVPHTVLDDSVTNTYLVITLYSIWERNWISQCSVPCKQDAIQKIILLHLINFPVVPRSTCSTITFTFKCLYISARGPYACTTQPLVCLFTSPDFYNCERAEYKPLLEHLSVKQIGSVSSQKWAEQVLCSQECSWLHSSRVHK